MDESAEMLAEFHQGFVEAVEAGQIKPGISAAQARDLTIALMHGLTAQQMANEPEAADGSGRYGSLVPAALAMLRASWEPREPTGTELRGSSDRPDQPHLQEGGCETE
jgi:hypothetical protein